MSTPVVAQTPPPARAVPICQSSSFVFEDTADARRGHPGGAGWLDRATRVAEAAAASALGPATSAASQEGLDSALTNTSLISLGDRSGVVARLAFRSQASAAGLGQFNLQRRKGARSGGLEAGKSQAVDGDEDVS